MVGKVIIENEMVVVLSPQGNHILQKNNTYYNVVLDRLSLELPVWVEFSNDDDVKILTLYDYTFGTHLEGVSMATSRYDKNKYPMGGFLPGYHMLVCGDCKLDFVGDKKSTQCEVCGIEDNLTYNKNKTQEQIKKSLDSMTDYYSKLLKITRDINYRGAVDGELKRIREEINILKNKLK